MLIDLDDLALYGYCPLRYRYKVEWKLPYRELSPEQAYHDILGLALSALLLGLLRNKFGVAKNRAIQVFDRGWLRACRTGNWGTDKETGLKLEGHLALLEFLARMDGTVVGGRFPTSVAVSSGLALSHHLEGLIMQGDETSRRRLLVVHLSNERSPLWAPRYQPLKFQWALEVIRKQLGYDRGRVGHLIFSPWSTKPSRMREATQEKAEFRAAALSLAKGVEAQVYFQTPHKERCKTCFYKGICTARHCGDVRPAEVEKLKEALK